MGQPHSKAKNLHASSRPIKMINFFLDKEFSFTTSKKSGTVTLKLHYVFSSKSKDIGCDCCPNLFIALIIPHKLTVQMN